MKNLTSSFKGKQHDTKEEVVVLSSHIEDFGFVFEVAGADAKGRG